MAWVASTDLLPDEYSITLQLMLFLRLQQYNILFKPCSTINKNPQLPNKRKRKSYLTELRNFLFQALSILSNKYYSEFDHDSAKYFIYHLVAAGAIQSNDNIFFKVQFFHGIQFIDGGKQSHILNIVPNLNKLRFWDFFFFGGGIL